MKKTVASLIFLFASVAMANELYMGLDYALAGNTNKYTGPSNQNDSIEVDNAYSELKLQLGYGSEADVKAQAYFAYIQYDAGVYDNSNEALYEFGVELIKEFAYDEDFFPFIKAGLGLGFMDINGYTKDQVGNVSGSLGLGLRYKFDEQISIRGGMDFVFRQWNGVYAISDGKQTNLQDDATKFYIGADYRF